MKKYRLDFSQCDTRHAVYAVIKKELELPQWCGSNLSALWDALTGIMYVPAEITIVRRVAKSELESMLSEIIEIMYQAQDTYHEITVIEEP